MPCDLTATLPSRRCRVLASQHTHARTHTHTRTREHTRRHAPSFSLSLANTHTHTHTHPHTLTHSRTHTHSHTLTHTYTYTHTHTHTHKNTHTHTHANEYHTTICTPTLTFTPPSRIPHHPSHVPPLTIHLSLSHLRERCPPLHSCFQERCQAREAGDISEEARVFKVHMRFKVQMGEWCCRYEACLYSPAHPSFMA